MGQMRKKKQPRKDGSKRGKASSARKQDGTRHGFEPAPETSPTAGAFGRPEENVDRSELRDIGGPVPGEDRGKEEDGEAEDRGR